MQRKVSDEDFSGAPDGAALKEIGVSPLFWKKHEAR
jgi:hypothetical protein